MQMQMFSVYPIPLNYLKQKIESRALELIARCGLFNTFWNLFWCVHTVELFCGKQQQNK